MEELKFFRAVIVYEDKNSFGFGAQTEIVSLHHGKSDCNGLKTIH